MESVCAFNQDCERKELSCIKENAGGLWNYFGFVSFLLFLLGLLLCFCFLFLFFVMMM